MLAGKAPGSFAVPREIDDGQRFTHVWLLRRCPGMTEPGFQPVAIS
jgi:hypothetical protein